MPTEISNKDSRNQRPSQAQSKLRIESADHQKTSISIIIPSNHLHVDLVTTVILASEQPVTPTEIIIVDSSTERGRCPEAITEACKRLNIGISYQSEEISYPGRARNIGLNSSKCDLICFLDVKTWPRSDWLEQISSFGSDPNLDGIWGSTEFSANSPFEGLIRDGFFGRRAIRTLPGTIIRKSTLRNVGQFIDWVRAGEDTDWMQRVDLHGMKFKTPSRPNLDYKGLIGEHSTAIARKWWRNYKAARTLPHLLPMKVLVWSLFYPTLILMAFNWNNLAAGWRTESLLYVPNITKLAAIIPVVVYLIIRGLVLPNRRGVQLLELLPVRWIFIAFVCLIGDVAKALAILIPTAKRHTP